jgi:hypothetical protein
MQCAGGGTTIVTGHVYEPAGDLPLYNAMVYVPSVKPDPFTSGASCDRCGGQVTGSPLVATLTGADGAFELDNVPAGDAIPLVIQIGRWRRQITIPHVAPCTTTALTNPDLQRLPRNQNEGDIPQMAIATGAFDPFECLLRKVGIADSEFTPPTATGRVHYYRSNGLDTHSPAAAGSLLWSQLSTLLKYDVVILPCEGMELKKPPAATQNLIDYTTQGGRVFTTHFGYEWIKDAQAPFSTDVADWSAEAMHPPDPFIVQLDTSFPKGKAFAQWLVNVGVNPVNPGTLTIHDARHDVVSVKPIAQRWIYGTNPMATMNQSTVQHFTFNTPWGDMGARDDMGQTIQCGRVVYSDFHVSVDGLTGAVDFPEACDTGPFTDQEKALVFMLFDLSSCVQPDTTPPVF